MSRRSSTRARCARRQRQELEQLALGLQEAGAHRRRDAAQAAEFAATLADLEPGLEAARSAEQAAAAGLAAAEAAMHDWQERWEQFNHALRSASSAGEAERARLEELDNQLRRLLAQRDRASQEQAALAGADVAATLAELARSEEEMRTRLEAARQGMARGTGSLQEERSRERELAEASRAARRETQDAEGRIVSLEALQRAALGQGQGKVVDWLKSCGLESSPRLARQLSVDAGWERAVETVLGSYLEAVCVESIDDVAGTLHSLTGGTVTFFAGAQGPAGSGPVGDGLRARVQGPAGLDALFEGIIATDSLAEALSVRPRLRAGQSVVTRDGIWIGADWLRVSRDRDAHEGVIEREQELRRQHADLERLQARGRGLEEELEAARGRVRELEDRLADEQAQLSRDGAAHMNLRSQVDSLRARADQRSARMQQLATELAELAEALEVAGAGNRSARARLEEAVDAMADLEERRRALETERDGLRQSLAEARQRAEQDRNAAREVAIRVESHRTGHASLLGSIERLDKQIAQFESRRVDLDAQLGAGDSAESGLKATLEAALEQRLAVEGELTEARRALEALDADMRQLDEQRATAQAAVQEARELLENVKFSVQELRLRRESLLEQFATSRLELAEVSAALDPAADVVTWEQRLAEVSEKIERLGQVNLAAIDEFREQSERKEYLDRQFTDLNDALATLEDAIRKDRPGDAQPFPGHVRPRQRGPEGQVPAPVRRRARLPRARRRGRAGVRRGHHGPSAGQAEQLDQPALRRREGAHGGGARVLDLRAEPRAVLPAGRSGRPARREQRRALLRDRPRDVGTGAVHLRHAQQVDHGTRAAAAGRDHERARRVASRRRGRGRGHAARGRLRQR